MSVRTLVPIGTAACLLFVSALAGPPQTGPETEKRFPLLKVPPGFKATLFACDPLVEYPSAVALGPRPRSIFVAADYMTGLGTEIIRRDEIRLIEDADGDGYADKATVYAQGFNSIQGLAYHAGTLYVMHAPFLSALRDTKGTGVADQRQDLLTGLGLPPEENPVRLHCANGVAIGHDGWLYLALGDHGCDVPRPEGDRLVLKGGGILRCRPDGRDLHVFATGLRNIYDVALDADMNVFVRDNENDGGTYMVRACHSFLGADHGYPYLYEERPDEALPPLADLGLGSSAGGLCYLERQFPPAYQGNLFFCEWGRAVVRYRPQPKGSGFAPLKEFEFAAGAQNDRYPFKPTDLVVLRDGSLIVVDWADDQRPRRGRGRVYRITYPGQGSAAKTGFAWLTEATDLAELIRSLDSESYYERCQAQIALEARGGEGATALLQAMDQGSVGVRGRLHAIWVLAHRGGRASLGELFRIARSDPEPRVQAQAVRALVDLTDPVLIHHRLNTGPGDAQLAADLAALAVSHDPRAVFEVVIALGRLRWADAPDWLRKNLSKADAALAHAAMQTLRRSENWPAVLQLLDVPSTALVRALALRALGDRYESTVVDGVIERLRKETDPVRRRELADVLTRVYKKPGPWVYWGYRPPPRSPNSLAWERTDAIANALDHVLTDPDRAVRFAVLRRMQREKIPTRPETLGQWLLDEHQAGHVAAILESLRGQPAARVRSYLQSILRDRTHVPVNRLLALGIFAQGLDPSSEGQMLQLAGELEDGPVLAGVLRQTGKRRNLEAASLLSHKLSSPSPEVRAVAIEALAELRVPEARQAVLKLLDDPEAPVRMAAVAAAGKLQARQAVEPLLKRAHDMDPGVRRASLSALGQLREPRAVPLAIAALTDRQVELQALECIGELSGPDQAGVITDLAKRNPSAGILSTVVRILTTWGSKKGLPPAQQVELDRAIAEIQGASGTLLRWHFKALPGYAAQFNPEIGPTPPPREAPSNPAEFWPGWRTLLGSGVESRVHVAVQKSEANRVWFGVTDLVLPEQTDVDFLASSKDTLEVLLNGRWVYRPRELAERDSDRFRATLAKGLNRLLVRVVPQGEALDFYLRYRRMASTADRERLTQAALNRPGDAESGRKVFFDVEKSQCLKCHRLGDHGERIGPELTGVGSRFSRIYVVESILDPSRTIAPSFETLVVALHNGQLLSGVKVAESETTLTLADNQGQKHVIAKPDIEEQRASSLSTMPDGLDKRITEQEFVDLIAFLVSQKETRAR
jgi:putative membrane-bound dehydrogenase-like protein